MAFVLKNELYFIEVNVMRNTNTKRTTLSSLILAATTLFMTSCGLDKLGDDFDVNQQAQIDYSDYVEIISAGFQIQSEDQQGFGLVAQALDCDQLSVRSYNSDTGFNDTYPNPYTSGNANVLDLGNIAGGSINIVKGDTIDIRLEKVRCATGIAGSDEIYMHPDILRDQGGGNMVEKDAGSNENQKDHSSALPAAGSLGNDYVVQMKMTGADGKIIKFKYTDTCATGCTDDDISLSFSASGFVIGDTVTAAAATYGSTVSFSFGGFPAPEYTHKAIKYQSTDQANGWLKFNVAFECSVATNGNPAEANSKRVHPTQAHDVTGDRDPQCAGTSHIGKKVVWINKGDGGWNDDSVAITEEQAIAAVEANESKAHTVVAGDLVPGGKKPIGGQAESRTVNPADSTMIDYQFANDKDGFAVPNIQTADSFYSSGLKKYICVYVKEDGTDRKGINCTLIDFNAFP